MQWACTANVSEAGKVKYTCMLNESGGIESDFTVYRSREKADEFYVVVAGATGEKDLM